MRPGLVVALINGQNDTDRAVATNHGGQSPDRDRQTASRESDSSLLAGWRDMTSERGALDNRAIGAVLSDRTRLSG